VIKRALIGFALLAASPAAAQWQVPLNSIPLGKGQGAVGFKTILGGTGSGTKCLVDSTPPAFVSCGGGSAALIINSTGLTGGTPSGIIYNNAGTLGNTGKILIAPDVSAVNPFYIRNNSDAFSLLNSAGTLEFVNIAQNGNATFGGNIIGSAYNGLAITPNTGNILTIGSGKTFVVNNTLGLSGTDGSTLNVGSGGTLGSNAFTSTPFAPLASPTFTGTVTVPNGASLGTPAALVLTNATGLPLSTGVTGTLGATQFPALTGDLSTMGGTLTTILANVNSNVGTFGDGSHVGQFTVNAKGLITAASSIALSGLPPSGSATGDLSGTYPGPTLATTQTAAHTWSGIQTNNGANTYSAMNTFIGAGAAKQLGITDPTRVLIVDGSSGTPVTSLGPTVLVSRYENNASFGAQNAAFYALSVGSAASNGQPVAIQGYAYNLGSSDAVALFGRAEQHGTNNKSAIAGFTAALAYTTGSGAIGFQTETTNSTSQNAPYFSNLFGHQVMLGLDVNYDGSSGFYGTAGISIRSVNGQWDVGLAFQRFSGTNPTRTADIQTDSDATNILIANSGAHTYGINLIGSGSTYSTYAFVSPGFSVNGSGDTIARQSLMNNGVVTHPTQDLIKFAPASGNLAQGFGIGRSLSGGDAHDFFIYDFTNSAVRFAISSTGSVSMASLPTSAGAGGLTVCIDTAGVLYKKATCP
jgi:hypothetical protein